MGLFVPDDEYPYWTHIWDFVKGTLIVSPLIAGAGIYALVVGNTAGRVVGVVLLVVAVAWMVSEIRRLRRHRRQRGAG